MEIIKPRTDKQEQVECPACGATIGYYETEVKQEYLPGYVSRWRTVPPIFLFTYIVCPSCGRRIVLEDAREGRSESLEGNAKRPHTQSRLHRKGF